MVIRVGCTPSSTLSPLAASLHLAPDQVLSDVPHYLGCLDLLPHTSWSHGHSCRMHSIIYTVSTGSFLTPGFGGSRVRSCILRSTFEAAPLLEFTYFAFTRTQGGVTVGESGLCCCVPCLSSAIISPCLGNLSKPWILGRGP